MLKGYTPGQLVFGRDMILLIKHMVDWELICQKNQEKINKYNIKKNSKIVDYDYEVRYQVIMNNKMCKNMKTCL